MESPPFEGNSPTRPRKRNTPIIKQSLVAEMLIAHMDKMNNSGFYIGASTHDEKSIDSVKSGSRLGSMDMGTINTASLPVAQVSITSPTHINSPSSSPVAASTAPGSSSGQRKVFQKNIVGDLFGSTGEQSLAGLMYRSRIEAVMGKKEEENNHENIVNEDVKKRNTDSNNEEIIINSDSDSDIEDTNSITTKNSKQQLALTIKNWSQFPENDSHIINEGGVYALIAMSYIDDILIKKCCAYSFYYLSLREKNRQQLLNLGTAGGVNILAVNTKSWSVAKLSALTLCNLSMEKNGEAIMAKESAILGLVSLLGLKGQSLLPICVQALYNMTCSQDHFKGIERIIKAILNISTSNVFFDYSEFLVKSLVNVSRYSWLRLRIIEDGIMTSLHSLIQNTALLKENKNDLVYYIIVGLRSLSESVSCRIEMLSKGCIEILQNLLPYSDERCLLFISKIIYNFLQAPSQISKSSFELSLTIISNIILITKNNFTIQYCSASYFIFTKEKLRNITTMSGIIVDSMNVLLKSSDYITQFFSISSAGNLFFDNLINDEEKLTQLVKFFILNGPSITDPAAKQALALALAKLLQNSVYADIIDSINLLPSVLDLLVSLRDAHKDSLLLQESCCIAICRVALRINVDLKTSERQQIANIFLDMLHTDDQYVIQSTVSGIKALGSSGLCPKELLSDNTLLIQIARIISKFNHIVDLCRIGCGVLAVFSYDINAHDMLADPEILTVLFANINSEDSTTRELVANTVCNLSLHATACETMVKMNAVTVFGQLSSSTSEVILDLCAKTLCNLTCNPKLHYSMIQNKVLDIFLMISLVRTVNYSTKCTCAKGLINLIHDNNLQYINESGAIRIFASLSTIPNYLIQKLCSKGFYLLTINKKRRIEFIKNITVLQSLFHMIKLNNITSSRVKIRLGISIINLLACPLTCQAAIQAGALSCLKIIATMDFEELREAVARIILNLALLKPTNNYESNTSTSFLVNLTPAAVEFCQKQFYKEPVIPILIYILQNFKNYTTMTIAISSISCLSSKDLYRNKIINEMALESLISCIFNKQIKDINMCQEICRILTQLSYLTNKVNSIISTENLSIALQIIQASNLFNSVTSFKTQVLLVLIIRNFSENFNSCKLIVQQDLFKMCFKILSDTTAILKNTFDERITNEFDSIPLNDTKLTDIEVKNRIGSLLISATIKLIFNLASHVELHEQLIQQGVIEIIHMICIPSSPKFECDKNSKNDKISYRTKLQRSFSVGKKLLRSNSSRSFSHSPRNSDQHTQIDFEEADINELAKQFSTTFNNSIESINSEKSVTDSSQVNSSTGNDDVYILKERYYVTPTEVNNIAEILCLISSTSSCHNLMVEKGILHIFKSLIYSSCSEKCKCSIAQALSNITSTKSCRQALVNDSAVELLIALSITSNIETQRHCATALTFLSEITKVNKGVVASLLLLGLHIDNHQNNINSGSDLNDKLKVKEKNLEEGKNDSKNSNSKTDPKKESKNSQTENNLSSSGLNNAKNQSLTNALRMIMTDKKQFDSYVEVLKQNNEENLTLNEFIPKNTLNTTTSIASSTAATTAAAPVSSNFSFLFNENNEETDNKKENEPPSVDIISLPQTTYSQLAVSVLHSDLLVYEEQELLYNDYSSFAYSSTDINLRYENEIDSSSKPVDGIIKMESGGLSKPLNIELPLPTIPVNRTLDPPNRHDELLKIPVDENPLPKVLTTPKQLEHQPQNNSPAHSTNPYSSFLNNNNMLDEDESLDSAEEFDLPDTSDSKVPINGSKLKTIRSLGKLSKVESNSSLTSPSKTHASLMGPIDARSPLAKHNSNIFKGNHGNLSPLAGSPSIKSRKGLKHKSENSPTHSIKS